MQARATLRLGSSCVSRTGTRALHKQRLAPFHLALTAKYRQLLPGPCSTATIAFQDGCPTTAASLRHFGSNKKTHLVHETPHYMDYDTLVDMHLVTRQSFGDRPLFGTKQEGQNSGPAFDWVTYKDFGKEVDRCRAALSDLGIGKGDVVGIISCNRVEWAVCAYATYSLGAVFVPMYEEQVGF